MQDYFFNFQLALDEQQVLITFDTQALGQLAYEYGSKMPFGASALPVPETMEEAKAQIRRHENTVQLSLMDRENRKQEDVTEAAKLVFGTSADDVETDDTDVEEDVNMTDHDQTKWVSVCNTNAQQLKI